MIREAIENCAVKSPRWNGVGACDNGYEYWLGSEYDEVQDADLAEITRRIRADLKLSWSIGEDEETAPVWDPKYWKVSVRLKRYAGGASINVWLTWDGPTIDIVYDYREEVKAREHVKEIAKRYLRQTTHAVSDGFWSNFILFVDYDGPTENLIYDLGARPKVTEADYISRAQEQYAEDSNYEVAIYDDAEVSPSGAGAFVQAWVWVPLSDFEGREDEETEQEIIAQEIKNENPTWRQ